MTKKPTNQAEWHAYYQATVTREFPALQPDLDRYVAGENPAFPQTLLAHTQRLAAREAIALVLCYEWTKTCPTY